MTAIGDAIPMKSRKSAAPKDDHAALLAKAAKALPRGMGANDLSAMEPDKIRALASVTQSKQPAIGSRLHITAAPRTKPARVPSPTVPGASEELQRVFDPIEAMYKRRQLSDAKDDFERTLQNERACRAALRLRAAHDVVYGSIGGAMDFDRVRGGGLPGSPPPLHYRLAADTLIGAKKNLYGLDHRVVTLVACEGHTIEQAAWAVYHREPTRAEKEEIGRVLRQSLRELADLWFAAEGRQRPQEIGAYHAPDADPALVRYSTAVGTVTPGKTVTATRNRVYRNKYGGRK